MHFDVKLQIAAFILILLHACTLTIMMWFHATMLKELSSCNYNQMSGYAKWASARGCVSLYVYGTTIYIRLLYIY